MIQPECGMQVVTWSAYARDRFGVNVRAVTQTATLDLNSSPPTVSRREVAETNHDMFCPGISMIGDGSIVVTGAHLTSTCNS